MSFSLQEIGKTSVPSTSHAFVAPNGRHGDMCLSSFFRPIATSGDALSLTSSKPFVETPRNLLRCPRTVSVAAGAAAAQDSAAAPRAERRAAAGSHRSGRRGVRGGAAGAGDAGATGDIMGMGQKLKPWSTILVQYLCILPFAPKTCPSGSTCFSVKMFVETTRGHLTDVLNCCGDSVVVKNMIASFIYTWEG